MTMWLTNKIVGLLALGCLTATSIYGQNCRPVAEIVQRLYPELAPSSGSSGSCTYRNTAKTNVSGVGPTLVITLYSNNGRGLELYSRPLGTVTYKTIPNLGQLSELLIFTPANSYFSVYRNDKCALDIRYFQWGEPTERDMSNIPVIVNSLLGPATVPPMSPPNAAPAPITTPNPPAVHTSPATYGLTSPDCRVITEAVRQSLSGLRGGVTEMPGRDGCFYKIHDPYIQNSKDKTIIITLYGEHGEPISSYHRPGSYYRTLPDLGQLAEYIEVSGISKTEFVLYRDNRRMLEIDYANFPPNPAIVTVQVVDVVLSSDGMGSALRWDRRAVTR